LHQKCTRCILTHLPPLGIIIYNFHLFLADFQRLAEVREYVVFQQGAIMVQGFLGEDAQ